MQGRRTACSPYPRASTRVRAASVRNLLTGRINFPLELAPPCYQPGAFSSCATAAVAAGRALHLPRVIARQSFRQEDSSNVFQIEPQHAAHPKCGNATFPVRPPNGLYAHSPDLGDFLYRNNVGFISILSAYSSNGADNTVLYA
jgi:hypothetical protein